MLINVVAQDPDLRVIEKIIKIINNDGLIVIPTDTIYAFAISMKSKKGLERLAKIKNTGNFLPGHGGILDRIDGILLGLPAGTISLLIIY